MRITTSITICIAVALGMLSTSAAAQTFTVTVEPGAYVGLYEIDGIRAAGTQVFSLPAGRHAVFLRSGAVAFEFDVDGGGLVTVPPPYDVSATGAGDTLTFRTAAVSVDPGSYVGLYDVGFLPRMSGSAALDLVPGVRYQLSIRSDLFFFDVDAAGQVTVPPPGDVSARGVGDTLVFETTTVQVDPDSYIGFYEISYDNLPLATGLASFDLIPGLRYTLQVRNDSLAFDVDAAGLVTVPAPDDVSAHGSGDTLIFETTTVHVEPGSYQGVYSITYDNLPRSSGPRTFELIRGLRFELGIYRNTFRFEVGADGLVQSLSAAGAGVGDTLLFQTTVVTLTPTCATPWNIIWADELPQASGTRTFELLRAITYWVQPGNTTFPIHTDADGNVTPGRVELLDGCVFTIATGPDVTEVAIDIKPGSDPNSINLRSKGVIPVAILTTGDFDATAVAPETVRFGQTGVETAAVQSAPEDVDGDGDIDIILHFDTQDAGIPCDLDAAVLRGQTTAGQAIEGADAIRTVSCK